MMMGTHCSIIVEYDERPPPRRAPRGGFNYRFAEPEIAPLYSTRGPESGVLKEIRRIAFFIIWV
jgi:hypothetical protein